MVRLTEAALERLRDRLRNQGERPSIVLPAGAQSQFALMEAIHIVTEFGPLSEAMFLVMLADGKVKNVERDVLRGALRVISGNRIRSSHIESMLDAAARNVAEYGIKARLDAVISQLREDSTRAEIAYIIAAAVAAADDDVVPEELSILEALAEGLGIDEKRVNELVNELEKGAPVLAVETSPRTPLRWFFLGAFVLSAAVSYGLALPLGVGAVLGYITEQRVSSLLERLGKQGRPHWRDGLTGVFIVGTLTLVFLPVGIAVYVAILDLVRLLTRIDWGQAAQWIERVGTPVLDRLAKLGVEVSGEQLRNKATELVASSAGAVGGFLGVALSYTPEALFNALVTLLGWFVFATTGQDTRDRVLPRLIPWPSVLRILRETTAEVIESVIIANILVSVVQSAMCTIPLVLLGVPRALVWGVMSFFLSFIPIVGTVPVTLGAALWCYTQGKTTGAVVMVVVAIVVGSIDNVLRPLFMRSSKAELSTLWLIVALTSGVSLFGVAGIILGPLAFSLFVAFSQGLDAEEAVALLPPSPIGAPDARPEETPAESPREPPGSEPARPAPSADPDPSADPPPPGA